MAHTGDIRLKLLVEVLFTLPLINNLFNFKSRQTMHVYHGDIIIIISNH